MVFTDDIKSDKSFINVIKSVASKWGDSELRSRYLEQSIYNCKSNLKTQWHDINIKCNEFIRQLNEPSETRPKPNMNASLITLGLLNIKRCDRDILDNLKQQNATMNSKNVATP